MIDTKYLMSGVKNFSNHDKNPIFKIIYSWEISPGGGPILKTGMGGQFGPRAGGPDATRSHSAEKI